jgi:predicted DNA-binding antitoxin AbrB/MazE fold protein
MSFHGEIPAVYENGVFRPDRDPHLPNHARVVLSVREEQVTPESNRAAHEVFARIRAEGGLRLNGWHPKRDELHERR